MIINICLIIVIFAIIFTIPHVESFVNMERDAVDNNYRQRGIEKCSLLDNKSVASSTFLDTLRIQKWKPSTTDVGDNHCFYYKTDPLAKLGGCDSNNPMFSGLPFVKRVFSDASGETATDTLGEKCVFELDPKTLDPAKFWAQMGPDASCKALLLSIQAEQDGYYQQINALDEKVNGVKKNASTAWSRVASYIKQQKLPPKTSWQALQSRSEQLTQELGQKKLILTQGQSNLAQSQLIKNQVISTYQEQYQTLTTAINNMKKDNNVLLGKIQHTKKMVEHNAGVLEKLNASTGLVQKDYDTCMKLKEEKQNTLTSVQNSIITKTSEIDSYTKLVAEQDALTQLLSNQVEALASENKQLKAQLGRLVPQQQSCRRALPFYQNEQRDTARTLAELKTQYESCMGVVGQLDPQIQDYMNRIKQLQAEIVMIDKALREQENYFLVTKLDNAQKLGKAIVDTSRDTCTAMKQMQATKVALQIELAKIRAPEPKLEDPTYKLIKRGQMGFNDEKGEALADNTMKLWTTSGRIDSIRDLMKDAPVGYIQLVYDNGQSTDKMYRVKETKRTKGDKNNWIIIGEAVVKPIKTQIAQLIVFTAKSDPILPSLRMCEVGIVTE
jgi:hypothetical protein